MNILDKIALNRLISIVTNFILGLIKIFSPKSLDDIDIPKPAKPRKKIIPWRNNNE
jgi:hypothetical protein